MQVAVYIHRWEHVYIFGEADASNAAIALWKSDVETHFEPLIPEQCKCALPLLSTLLQLTSFAVVSDDLAQLELRQLELYPQWSAVYTQLAPPSPPPSPQRPAADVHSSPSSPQQLTADVSNPDDPTDGVHSALVALPAHRSSRVSVHSAHPVFLSEEDVVHVARRARGTARMTCSKIEISSDSSDSSDSVHLAKKKKRAASSSKKRATSGRSPRRAAAPSDSSDGSSEFKVGARIASSSMQQARAQLLKLFKKGFT